MAFDSKLQLVTVSSWLKCSPTQGHCRLQGEGQFRRRSGRPYLHNQALGVIIKCFPYNAGTFCFSLLPLWGFDFASPPPPASSSSALHCQPGAWLVRPNERLLIVLQQSEEGNYRSQKPDSARKTPLSRVCASSVLSYLPFIWGQVLALCLFYYNSSNTLWETLGFGVGGQKWGFIEFVTGFRK